jgi:hypothetical protein
MGFEGGSIRLEAGERIPPTVGRQGKQPATPDNYDKTHQILNRSRTKRNGVAGGNYPLATGVLQTATTTSVSARDDGVNFSGRSRTLPDLTRMVFS